MAHVHEHMATFIARTGKHAVERLDLLRCSTCMLTPWIIRDKLGEIILFYNDTMGEELLDAINGSLSKFVRLPHWRRNRKV